MLVPFVVPTSRRKPGCGAICAAGGCRALTKFVRQEPIGPYIVDFLCREARLIVEVDGATHSEDHEVAYDRRREAYLKREGYRIVRVLNNDVYTHINDVLEMILMSLEGKL